MSNHNYNDSRRRFLGQSGLGLLALSGMPGVLRAMEGMSAMPKLAPRKATPGFNPDVEFELLCKTADVSILQGKKTRVMQYVGKMLHGPENTLVELPGSYLGPIFNFQKGQKVRIRLQNALSEPTVAHWHGLHVPADVDGHPMAAIDPGQELVYEFEVLNRAGMHIYHPHPHEQTAKQVYHGLAGAILVNDDEEAALGLPSGKYELPVVIQDRLFDHDNQLIYVRHMRDRMMGFYGDRILVNGYDAFKVDVDSRAYRLRIMNGSNARIYKLAWSNGMPLTVLGVDGGLLERPAIKNYVMLAPGERLDVWADFSGIAEGVEVTLRSLPFSGALPRMGMMMHGGKLPMGSDYPIFTAKITRKVSDSPNLPTQLSSFKHYTLDDVANPDKPVPLGITEGHMAMLLNGRPYAYNDVLPFERIPVNTVQLMEVFHAHGSGHSQTEANNEANESQQGQHGGGMRHGMMGGGMGGMGGMRHGMMGGMGQDGEGMQGGMQHGGQGGGMMGMGGGMGGGGMGMMMSMAHPIHLHGQQFQIISRSIDMDDNDDYATVRDGYIDSGLKDTVLVMPGERVRIIKPFGDFKGLFMYHCHNLEHEDMGMMREFEIY